MRSFTNMVMVAVMVVSSLFVTPAPVAAGGNLGAGLALLGGLFLSDSIEARRERRWMDYNRPYRDAQIRNLDADTETKRTIGRTVLPSMSRRMDVGDDVNFNSYSNYDGSTSVNFQVHQSQYGRPQIPKGYRVWINDVGTACLIPDR